MGGPSRSLYEGRVRGSSSTVFEGWVGVWLSQWVKCGWVNFRDFPEGGVVGSSSQVTEGWVRRSLSVMFNAWWMGVWLILVDQEWMSIWIYFWDFPEGWGVVESSSQVTEGWVGGYWVWCWRVVDGCVIKSSGSRMDEYIFKILLRDEGSLGLRAKKLGECVGH